DAQAQRPGGEAARATPSRVPERLLACLRRLALGVERLRRAVAVIRAAGRDEPRRVRAIALEALRLAVARRRRALVPVDAEPLERVDDERNVLVGRARPIGVLDPKDERAAVVTRVEPVEERRPGAPDVEMPGRTRGEPHPYGIGRRA